MAELTLLRSGSPLASPARQRDLLDQGDRFPAFETTLQVHDYGALRSEGISTLQVNLGRLCNQTCTHCHVDAGPDRRETMSREVADGVLRLLDSTGAKTLDITGGAPEMNAEFRYLVQEASVRGCEIIDRCNLTILVAPGYTDLPEFLAVHNVQVVASLPCYLEENVDKQRGDRVFQRSITALQRLNALGYGQPDSKLSLTLVYNPTGPSLPPGQAGLEAAYRRELKTRYDIDFTALFTITNMPISRFLADLLEQKRYDDYMETLISAFNPETVERLMCRTMLSIDWQGYLYDCDFNQMLDMKLSPETRLNVLELTDEDIQKLQRRVIQTGRHCFGCTAGAGSSCQGNLRSAR